MPYTEIPGAKRDSKLDLTEFSNYFESKKFSKIDDATIGKFHSAVRWAKPNEEIKKVVEEAGSTMKDAVAGKDPKNGNYALHIAAQNGHMDLVKFLIAEKANVDVQNGKGQTPLHMSIEYDFYFQTKLLLEANANPNLKNEEGHAAMLGIDGGKVDGEAWDNPVIIMKAATKEEEVDYAFTKLEQAAEENKESVDKGTLVQAGMLKKKTLKESWDHKRFMQIAQKF